MSTRKKQVIVLSLGVILILAGFFQNNIKQWGSNILSSLNFGQNDDGNNDVDVDANKDQNTGNNTDNDYFKQARLDRDVSRGRTQEAFKEITQDTNASEAVKSEAYTKMMEIIAITDKEKSLETMIKDKGFNDAFVCFSDIGEIDITVKSETLTEDQVTQVCDIVARHAEVGYDKIHIKSVK